MKKRRSFCVCVFVLLSISINIATVFRTLLWTRTTRWRRRTRTTIWHDRGRTRCWSSVMGAIGAILCYKKRGRFLIYGSRDEGSCLPAPCRGGCLLIRPRLLFRWLVLRPWNKRKPILLYRLWRNTGSERFKSAFLANADLPYSD